MGIRGRFKGFRTEATVAKMTAEEQKMYRDFVKEVENAQRNNLPLPEPPKFSTDKPEKPVNTTGKKRGRKPGSRLVNGKMVSAEEYEKIKGGAPATKSEKNNKFNEVEDSDDDTDDVNIIEDDDTEDQTESKREQLVSEIIEAQTKYLSEHTPVRDADGKAWWDANDSKSDVQETVIHHVSREGFCIIETNEYFWLNRIKKMIEKCPDKVIVLTEYSGEDLLRVKVPYQAMKKVNVSTRTMTEEQRQRMSELGKSRKKKTEEVVEGTTEEPEVEETVENTVEDTSETTPEITTEAPNTDTSVVATNSDKKEEEVEQTEEVEDVVEHVEAEIVPSVADPYDEEEEEEEYDEGEDDFDYEPASLGRVHSEEDEVVFERPPRFIQGYFHDGKFW